MQIYNQVLDPAVVAALAIPAAAPTNLTVTAASGTELDLNWVDHATNATGYKLERSVNGGASFDRAANVSFLKLTRDGWSSPLTVTATRASFPATLAMISAVPLATGKAIMTPYSSTPVQGTITELYINPTTLKARVQWSQGAATHSPGDIIDIPDALKIGGTYLIYSEVKYNYVPGVAWFINKVDGITLSDYTFTRPRQGLCVMYITSACTTT